MNAMLRRHIVSDRDWRPHAPHRDMAESELFGHERGALTKARQQRGGRALAANDGTPIRDELEDLSLRGTLSLDEVEDLNGTMQGYLVRFLATGGVRRAGSDPPLRITPHVVEVVNWRPCP
jgi:DNA-binding NtrC family response regulator